jgi:hypothetical protein
MPKKKRYIVVPRTTGIQQTGLKTGKGTLSFKGKTAMWVDESVASEIDTQHGLKGSKQVWVAQDENLEWHEKNDGQTDGRKILGIHKYTFAQMGTHLPPRDKLIGKLKVIGGSKYMYEMKDGKLKLVPYKKGKRES